MTPPIQIQFQRVTTTSGSLTIAIDPSTGSFQLTSAESFLFNGTFPFSSLSMTTSLIGINSAPGTAINGSIGITAASSSGDPVLTVTNFSGLATISWQTNQGMSSNTITSGNPITLTHFTS